jgi:hypothetical protein
MLEKKWTCDLCERDVSALGSGWPPSKRVRFGPNDVVALCDLKDTAASEKVICGRCIDGLKKVLGSKE